MDALPLRRWPWGIGHVVLLALYEGFDMARGDQAQLMPERPNLAVSGMCAGASFHRDNAARLRAEE